MIAWTLLLPPQHGVGASEPVSTVEFEAVELPPDLARILRRGTLRVAMNKLDHPPFFSADTEGRPTGLDVDIARDIADRLGVELRLVRDAASFDAVVDTVARGEADVAISVLSRTLRRAQRVRFTRPYAHLRQALLVNRRLSGQLERAMSREGDAGASNLSIGTFGGSSYVDFARQSYPGSDVVTYDAWPGALNDLRAGRLHAFMFDEFEVPRPVEKNPRLALELRIIYLDRLDPISMAVNWRDRHLLAWLDYYLETIEANGFMTELRGRHLDGRR